jgi:hypothetical protein
MTRGISLDVVRNKKADEIKAKKKFFKQRKIDTKKHTAYQLDLMWMHHNNGQDDLVELVQEGLLNRSMRRIAAKNKQYKPQRMSKADCINTLMFYSKMNAYDPNPA